MNFQNIIGFDVSKWQGSIDFAKMRGGGARFVIIKAGQGNWEDPRFAENWAKAKGILPRATYFYYDNRYPPKDQARKYYDIIRKDLEGMCWLDLEDRQTGMYAGWRNWFDFIEELRLLYPTVRVGIYTGFYYMVEMLTYATSAQKQYFAQFPLWLAWYFGDPFKPNYNTIMTPLPWLEYDILQSGTPAIGLDAGVQSREIDYNQFNGDEAKFTQMFGTIPPEVPESEPEQPTEGAIMQGKVMVNLNIRPTPGVSLPAIGQLAPGDVIEASGVIGGWWKLMKWTRNGAPLSLPAVECYAYSGASNGYIQEIVTPPAPTFPPRVGLTIGTETRYYVPE